MQTYASGIHSKIQGDYPQSYFVDESTMVFFDNSPLHPSILLNNILHQNLDREGVLKILLVKEKLSQMSESVSLDNSFYCEVVLTKILSPIEYVFQEIANNKINLKDQLDTKLIVENAADLNLKLMKWRQVPGLDLDILQKTSCLMLGSGSLGC